MSGIWQLPVKARGATGWLVNGWSQVVSGRDNSFSGENRDHADFIGGSDPNLGSSRPHGAMVRRYFNTAEFAANAVGTFGNTGKGIIRLPRQFNADVSMLKDTKLRERMTLQFRAEFFNVFNNVNLISPRGSGIINNASSAQSGRHAFIGILQCAASTRINPLRPPSERLVDERSTDAPVGAGDQDCLVRNIHNRSPVSKSASVCYDGAGANEDTRGPLHQEISPSLATAACDFPGGPFQ